MPATVETLDADHPPPEATAPSIATVDGQGLSVRDLADALRRIEALAGTGQGFTVHTLNLDHLVKLRENNAFRRAYAAATLVTADGWPIVHLARRIDPTIQRTTGADLVFPACELAALLGLPVYLYGSETAVLQKAAARLQRLIPGLAVAGCEAPRFNFDPDSDDARRAAGRIHASGARLCFVALGAPKQEVFSQLAHKTCPGVGFICIGAALDFIAGTRKRSPRLLQKLHVEWAWRLLCEPQRLGGRYLRCGTLFVGLLLRRGHPPLSKT